MTPKGWLVAGSSEAAQAAVVPDSQLDMTWLVPDESLRMATVMGWPVGTTRLGFSALMAVQSQVVHRPEKMSFRVHCVMFT